MNGASILAILQQAAQLITGQLAAPLLIIFLVLAAMELAVHKRMLGVYCVIGATIITFGGSWLVNYFSGGAA